MQVRTEYERSLFTDPLFSLQSPSSAALGTRGFSRVRREFSVLAEGRHIFSFGLEKSLAPRVGMG